MSTVQASPISGLLKSLGVDQENKISVSDFKDAWNVVRFKNIRGGNTPYPILQIDSGPKNIADVKNVIMRLPVCVVLFRIRSHDHYMLFLKAGDQSMLQKLEKKDMYDQMEAVFRSQGFAEIRTDLSMMKCIKNSIKSAPTHTSDFDNRGVFSSHYLKNRLFEDIKITDKRAEKISNLIKTEHATAGILDLLGWKKMNRNGTFKASDRVSIVVSEGNSLGTKIKDGIAPSYTAVSELKNSEWVILTNGTHWRLYTSKISSTTTNYFEINLSQKKRVIDYLVAIFSIESYEGSSPKIEVVFNEGKTYAKELEKDLASKILTSDGIFLYLARGVLEKDKKLKKKELEVAKDTSLKILYRVWFLLYAESRNLLPVRDERYKPMSLQTLRVKLDGMESEPDGKTCWDELLGLFNGIRSGSVKHNLPQYNGDLFKATPLIDGVVVKNRHIIPALRGLFEKDGEPMDYASLNVRHLGNIYETLMEYEIKQADKDIFLLEDAKGIREISAKKNNLLKKEVQYFYKKNELYLASKGGIASRKSSASYYTPQEIVEFLVGKALDPIFAEREKRIKDDLSKFKKEKSDENKRMCIDRLLDIQALDPTMGSGHFLVEALNRITSWTTEMIGKYDRHPLVEDIENDRNSILKYQKNKGIKLDEKLLTDDVLLKRKIMKKCIFGVDINPLAVELAKISLWLDSFAIGVPLTYMNHHLKVGDSTIGMWRNDLIDKNNQSLDAWNDSTENVGIHMANVSCNSDVTIPQVLASEDEHNKYEKEMEPHKMMLDVLASSYIDKEIIPKNTRETLRYVKQFENIAWENQAKPALKNIRKKVQRLSKKYRFFHWELEMMDAFTDKRRGFDVIVGNPPWDKIRPNSNEFFKNIDPTYKNKPNEEKQKFKKTHHDEFMEYKKTFDEKRIFYKKRGGIGENTDYELYRIIVERMLQILAPNGSFSMIMPSAIVNSRGATALRQYILQKNILSLYVFENKEKIFPIDTRQRFSLLSFRNQLGNDAFPAVFYLHSLDSLKAPCKDLLYLSKKKIKELSPKMSLIHEVKSKKDYEVIQKLLMAHPKLMNISTWSVDLGRELNIGEQKDKKLILKNDSGWPILESKDFHQHISLYSKPKYHADVKKTLERTKTIKKFHNRNDEVHSNPRLVYRSISSSTNTRTMIASIIPKFTFTTVNTYMAIPRIGELNFDKSYHKLNAYLCGIFNSTSYDYLLRPTIDKAVETYQLYDTPVPKNVTSKIANKIIKLSAILALSETWHDDMARMLSITKGDIKDNTLRKRIKIVAKIDALVALHYGLTRDEYHNVLASFKTDKKRFSETELLKTINYRDLPKAERDTHMRIFYNHVYECAKCDYDQLQKMRKND